ncbi:NAD-dependent epimerase/dehydratase family protein [Chitinimonas sp.]|uniref:NAD-dependent epimerase/dehydratase family protein n=1 Tax=Chitinimonas sp. TaxID=1934313 RepID=UPI0035AF0E72
MTQPTVLITGISGFIAKHCAIEMLNHGYRVRGTVRSSAKADEVRATLAKYADTSQLELVNADLLADAGWAEACAGGAGVLHLASPFPVSDPKDPQELIRPAVDGSLRVLKAAIAAKVPRFVQTSSVVAVLGGHPRDRSSAFTEADWTVDGPDIGAYMRSKTLAERAARDYLTETGANIHYASVNPGFVLGPLLDNDIGSSGEVIRMFLRGKYPGCPKLSFPVVDVRDIALMHRLALETEQPSGGRYLGVSGSAWFIDMMRPIKQKLGPAARKVPSFELPNFMIRLVAQVDPAARGIVADLGHEVNIDNSLTRAALGISFRGVEESAPAMAESLVALGLV